MTREEKLLAFRARTKIRQAERQVRKEKSKAYKLFMRNKRQLEQTINEWINNYERLSSILRLAIKTCAVLKPEIYERESHNWPPIERAAIHPNMTVFPYDMSIGRLPVPITDKILIEDLYLAEFFVEEFFEEGQRLIHFDIRTTRQQYRYGYRYSYLGLGIQEKRYVLEMVARKLSEAWIRWEKENPPDAYRKFNFA